MSRSLLEAPLLLALYKLRLIFPVTIDSYSPGAIGFGCRESIEYHSGGGNTSGLSSNLSSCNRLNSHKRIGSLSIRLRDMASTFREVRFPISSGRILIRLRLRSSISRDSICRILGNVQCLLLLRCNQLTAFGTSLRLLYRTFR